MKVKLFGFLLGLIFFSMEFLKDQMDSNNINRVLIVSVISVLFLIFAKEKQVKYYSSFWVEAIPIYWFLAMTLFV